VTTPRTTNAVAPARHPPRSRGRPSDGGRGATLEDVSHPAYAEVPPPRELRPFVERLWAHRIAGPPPKEGRRLLPDGRVSLVWVAGIGVQIAGPQTSYYAPVDLPEILAFGATFRPGAAGVLLRTPVHELVDSHVLLDAVLPELAGRLDDRLGHARDAAEAVTAFGQELARELRAADEPDPAVRDAVGVLDRRTGTVAEAARRAFVSERQLERRFAEFVGYGPKMLQRVLRFQRFLTHAGRPQLGLAGAAALAGYADQAHLSREARRLSGLTPSRLRTWQH
jgi:AraC-like DNA-binding protein